MLPSTAMLLALLLALSAPASSVYHLTKENVIFNDTLENNSSFRDDGYDLPLITWNGGTIKFEHTMKTSSEYPYYKVWVRNSGSHTMYVDIGDSKNNVLKAGQTKSFYGTNGVFYHNQDVIVTCENGYSLYGKIAIKTNNTSLE